MRLILPIIFTVVAVALFFVAIDPLYGDVRQLKADVNTYNIALNNSTELQKTRDALIEVYKNIKKEDKDRLEHFLPNTVNNIELILEIEKIANSHGLPIRDIKFESTNPANKNGSSVGKEDKSVVVADSDPSSYLPYGVFPVEFIVESNYDTFLSFLKDLERNLRLVDVKSISFAVPSPTTTNTTTNPNIFSYTLRVETYWLK